jgi:hypothetical protein
LCACPGAVPPVLFGSTPSRQFSTDQGSSIPTVVGIPAITHAQPAVDMTSMQQQRLQKQWEQEQQRLQQDFQKKQTQLYQQQMYQQQPSGMSTSGLITGPARSIESGIGDGFERFFQVYFNGEKDANIKANFRECRQLEEETLAVNGECLSFDKINTG